MHHGTPLTCHCEAPKGPWQSREGSYVFAGAFLLSTPVLRDSPVASLLGMAILIALRRRITTAMRATAVGAH